MSISNELTNVLQEYISDFLKKRNFSYVVKPSIPIVWFGDIEEYNESPKKVVTVGINPSLSEFEKKRFNIVDLECENAVDELVNTLNLYFKDNPYDWFNNFEKVLSTLDASYYEKKATNTAIHIDIYSAIATNPIWRYLSDGEKKDIQRTDLFKKLLNLLDPDIIVFSVNNDIFKDVFSDFKLEKSEDNINDKKGIFIRKYKNGTQILIWGRNMQGQPFGGLSNQEIRETMEQFFHKDNSINIVKTSNENKNKNEFKRNFNAETDILSSTSKTLSVEKISGTSEWSASIDSYVAGLKGYATQKNKEYLVAVLDILRTENRPMTAMEVKNKCFNNYNKYGIKDDEDSRKNIYECLYQHADCNKNSNAKTQSMLFVRDNLKYYAFDPNVKLW